ncbi:kinase-like domain-containing protein, partial [Amylostereum chailletii]
THQLGARSFGAVYRAQVILACIYYVIKCLFASNAPSTTDARPRKFEDKFSAEYNLRAKAQYCSHIISLSGKICEEDHYFLVFDFCEGGDLFSTLYTPYFWKRSNRIKEIMRHRGVSHRDIKVDTIFLSVDQQVCYLTDFGLAYAGVESSTLRGCHLPIGAYHASSFSLSLALTHARRMLWR